MTLVAGNPAEGAAAGNRTTADSEPFEKLDTDFVGTCISADGHAGSDPGLKMGFETFGSTWRGALTDVKVRGSQLGKNVVSGSNGLQQFDYHSAWRLRTSINNNAHVRGDRGFTDLTNRPGLRDPGDY